MKLSAINMVAYLFLPTKCINRGRLIWKSNALPKMISEMLIRNTQGQHNIDNVKSTCD